MRSLGFFLPSRRSRSRLFSSPLRSQGRHFRSLLFFLQLPFSAQERERGKNNRGMKRTAAQRKKYGTGAKRLSRFLEFSQCLRTSDMHDTPNELCLLFSNNYLSYDPIAPTLRPQSAIFFRSVQIPEPALIVYSHK